MNLSGHLIELNTTTLSFLREEVAGELKVYIPTPWAKFRYTRSFRGYHVSLEPEAGSFVKESVITTHKLVSTI